jgi:putative transposase
MEGCGALRDCRYLLHDRDTKYTQSFRAIIASGRVEDIIRGEKGAGKARFIRC